MFAMATYAVERDDYAGWSGAGRTFGVFALASGAIALVGWASLHGVTYGVKTATPSGQLLLSAMMWVGIGLCVLMAIAFLGSLMLSSKARGTVLVDDLGVTRQIGERSRVLRWNEIEGFVVTPISAGVTLIPREGKQTIVIPRFLEDYRGCIAEIKARGVKNLPPDTAQVRRVVGKKTTWRQLLLTYVGVFAFTIANNPRESHAMRLVGLAGCVGYFAWVATTDTPELEDHGWVRWFGGALLAGMLAWLVWHMMHT
jgi:hypothetical protein